MTGERGRHRDIDLSTLATLLSTDRTPAEQRMEARRDPSQPASRNVIAYFAANPRGTDPLRLGDECSDIQRELKLARFRDDFRFESCWAVTTDELVRQLNELDPIVVHLSLHGSPDGVLLQGDRGEPELVSPRALAALVGEAARRARVVVLNACSTTAHALALCTSVDVVVAMDGAIGDDAARMFAVRFYGALGNRRSIGNAVAQGVATLAAKRLPGEMLPRCVTRGDVDPRGIYLPSIVA